MQAQNAAGYVTINGPGQVGKTLTADTSDITDADGLSNVRYSYQWTRIEAGTTENNISGATNSTYTATSSDLGKALKVKVDFTDDLDNPETRTTGAVLPIVAAARACTSGNAWCAVLTVAYRGLDSDQSRGYCHTDSERCTSSNAFGSLSGRAFDLDSVTYTIERIAWTSNSPTAVHLTLDKDFPEADLDSLVLKVDVHEFVLSDATRGNSNGEIPAEGGVANNYRWSTGPSELRDYNNYLEDTDVTVEILQKAASNTMATGKPGIGGIPRNPQHGLTLTADPSGISDSDGLATPDYTYQWIRVNDDGSEADISGADGINYMLVSADVGKTLKVRVEFTDDADNAEMLTSDATATVVAQSVISFDNAMFTVTEGAGSFVMGLSLTPPAEGNGSVDLLTTYQGTATSADISGLRASLPFQDGSTVVSIAVSAVDDEEDDDGESVKITLGTLPPWMTLGSPAEVTITLQDNDSATACSITDPTQVWCATLTAGENPLRNRPASSGFGTDQGPDDVDFGSLSATTFTHEAVDYTITQLYAATFNGEFLIFATTPELHSDGAGLVLHIEKTSGELDLPLLHANLGENVSVVDGLEWEFRDAFSSDFGRLLYYDTAAGAMVEVRLSTGFNRPARGSVVIDGVAQVGNTLTADPSGISDINGLATPDYTYQWIRVNDDGSEADISTGSTYTVTAADVGKRLKVEVEFMDDANNGEESASGATARVVAAARACTPGNLWCATLNTVAGLGGYCRDVPGRCIPLFQDSFGSLSDDSFTLNGTPYLIKSLRWGTASAPGGAEGTNLHLTLDRDFPGASLASLTLKVGTHEFALSDAVRGNSDGEVPPGGVAHNYRWADAPQAIRDFGAEEDLDITVELLGSVPTDSNPEVRVKFTPESYTVAEGEDVAVTVLLNVDPEREVVIPVTAMNQGGASASDYSGAPTTLTFSSGETSKSFTVSATDDVVDDDGESVLLGFGSLPAGVTEALRATATVTITDDDERVVRVSPTALTVPEGERRTYEVVLGSEPTGTVTVEVEVSVHAGTEVTVEPTAVMFTAADWEVAKTLTVSVDDDMEVEADVTVTLTNTVSGADYGANGVAAESVSVLVPGYEVSGDEVLLLVDGGGVTVAAGTGTPVPAGLRLDLPAAHDGMTTVTIRRVDVPGESPEGFRLGDVVVDITGVELGADEEATVCLPSTEVGDLSVWYWSDATMAWVRLEARPSTDLVCGVTDHFTIFAVMVKDDRQREHAREAWLARFGRSVAGHVAEVVAGRLTTEQGSTAQWTLGNLLSLDDRQVLPGSSFVLPLSAEGAPGWTAWGRGAYSEFDGEEDGLELDGEVRSGTLGVDLERGAWRWGLALSRSKGDGDTAEAEGERLALKSTLTSAHPYARWQATEALSAWGMLGFGTGELEEERGGRRTETDLDMRMAAFGLRGALGARRDFGLAVKSDLLLVQMETDAEAGLSGETDTGRLRVLLEGAGRYPLESGGLLSPMLEAGLRYDEGDAETGLGAELGAGLRYADGSGQLSLALTTRALVAHEESEYEEWGVGGSLRLDGPRGRGLSLSLESALGATGQSTDELWTRRDLAGLARDDFVAAGWLKAEMGLGLNAVGGRGIFTPYARYEHMEGRRAWHLGGRLQAGEIIRLDFGGMQREARDNGAEHELTVELSGRW